VMQFQLLHRDKIKTSLILANTVIASRFDVV